MLVYIRDILLLHKGQIRSRMISEIISTSKGVDSIQKFPRPWAKFPNLCIQNDKENQNKKEIQTERKITNNISVSINFKPPITRDEARMRRNQGKILTWRTQQEGSVINSRNDKQDQNNKAL